MKKTRAICYVLLLALFSCTPVGHEEKAQEIFIEGEPHILLMHPTVQNLQRFIYLTEEGIFPLPENYRVVGVYHQNASYNYNQAAAFIARENLGNMALYAIDKPISEAVLFTNNELTDIFNELFRQSEGALFLGGPDIPPAVYGEPFNLLTVVTDPFRHYLEASFLFHLLGGSQNPQFTPLLEDKPDYPILGICLGMQTMNVATGGTLYQDIPTQIHGVTTVEQVIALGPDEQHRNYYSYYRLDQEVSTPSYHRIKFEGDSHMAVIAGGVEVTPFILSSHHQAIQRMGKGFRATAWSMDRKVIEAIEHTTYPHVVGIQFHPEVPYLYDSDHKITFRPGKAGTQSFLDLYPGALGEDFHRAFWVHIAGIYP